MTWRLWREGERWGWLHRPWWKVAINTALRFVQPRGPGRKLVVFTRVDASGETPARPPRVTGYGIGLVMHLAIEARRG